MRPIKFRAWEPDEKAKGGGTMWEVRELEWDAGGIAGAYLGLHSAETDSFILMQFTGLHDKNGRKIYEGDVVRHEYYLADEEHGTAKETEEIIYAGDSFGFKRGDEVLPLHECMSLEDGTAKALEIIGNIYENPAVRTI
jgi:uncharacterized phage protein (TIGR01671 family)